MKPPIGMRPIRAGLIGFAVTTCVLIPAGLHRLTAGSDQLAKLFAPDTDHFELAGTQIAVALDRSVLDPGDELQIALTADGKANTKLAVSVLVLGANGTEGGRVVEPPHQVGSRTITLATDAAGHAALTTSFRLRGAWATHWNPLGQYTVLVGAPTAIAKLEQWGAKSQHVFSPGDEIGQLNRPGEKFMTAFYQTDREPGDPEEDASPYSSLHMARLTAFTRPKSASIAVYTPDTAVVRSPFEVVVEVANPSRRAMSGLTVTLAQHAGIAVEEHSIVIAPASQQIDLQPGEARRVVFRATGTIEGVVGLYANARCTSDSGGSNPSCRDVEELELGAFDATEITPTNDPAPTITAAQ